MPTNPAGSKPSRTCKWVISNFPSKTTSCTCTYFRKQSLMIERSEASKLMNWKLSNLWRKGLFLSIQTWLSGAKLQNWWIESYQNCDAKGSENLLHPSLFQKKPVKTGNTVKTKQKIVKNRTSEEKLCFFQCVWVFIVFGMVFAVFPVLLAFPIFAGWLS